VFCDESYSVSPYDLVLFVMTCNCNSQPPQYEKNKIDKDNFEKNHKKKKSRGETLYQSIVFCEESYSAFPI